jgi:hypothetical protein
MISTNQFCNGRKTTSRFVVRLAPKPEHHLPLEVLVGELLAG